ncbi:MAG: hypothetical protein RLZZ618_1667 [Pseudomonadota bacterium]|jgi:general secretion pathway protein F
MPDFDVRLFDGGRMVQRQVQAPDARAIAGLLGVPASNIVSVQTASEPPSDAGRVRGSRFPLRLFSQELSVLLSAGLPLMEALVTLHEKEAVPSVAASLRSVIDGLQRGQPLSASLAARPESFDPLFIAIVSSAERTGQLGDALRAHAGYLAWVEDLRSKLVNASLYPLMLIVAGMSVLLFLLVFVVPRFAGLLEGLNGEMPAASRLLIDLGRVTGQHPWLTVAAGMGLLALPWVLWRQGLLQARVDTLLWTLPTLGSKLRLLALARFYRTASMLLAAGVPVVAALQIARGVVAARLGPALDRAIVSVSRGERLSDALEREGLCTPVSLRMVRVGERSGELATMLGQAAAFYDEELTRLSEVVTRLVNPVLMLLMGGLIGSVIVLMYLPIFQLVEQVQ